MNTLHPIRFLILAGIVFSLSAAPTRADLEWRVSVKFILNSDGVRPGEVGNPDSNCQSLDGSANSCVSEVLEKFAYANEVLARTGRGYRFRLTEITETDQLAPFFDCSQCTNGAGYDHVRSVLEGLVKQFPEPFKWRTDALNIYIHNRNIGGRSSTRNPGEPAPLILIGQQRAGGIVRPLHELGHALGLCHTHGCGNSACSGDDPGPGDDDIADTLGDSDCFNRDEVAQFTFQTNYVALSATNRNRVDNTFFNIMSYHADDGSERACPLPLDGSCRYRFTPDQLDRMTERSNRFWPLITSGRTWFVDANSRCAPGNGSLICVPGLSGPFSTVTAGVNNAARGDIVLLRGGTYHDSISITKPITLRASRGNAVVGIP